MPFNAKFFLKMGIDTTGTTLSWLEISAYQSGAINSEIHFHSLNRIYTI